MQIFHKRTINSLFFDFLLFDLKILKSKRTKNANFFAGVKLFCDEQVPYFIF